MSEDTFPSLPAWIRRRDGQLVPFDPQHISQSIFAATEVLGKANAFLARELTDSVVHFLVQEAGDEIPSTAQLGELIIKVVRELGQPALAQAYVEGRELERSVSEAATADLPEAPEQPAPMDRSIQEEVRNCLRDYSLTSVYSRDLAAAFRDGLLALTGLDKPAHLDGLVIEETEQGIFSEGRWWELLAGSRALAGSVVICDSPECWWGPAEESWLHRFFKVIEHEAAPGPRAIILNLHGPPARVKKAGASPLFGRPAAEQLPSVEWEMAWVEHVLASENLPVRVDWHIHSDDVRASEPHPALARLLNHPSAWNRVRCVFDRPRLPVSLAEGLVRGQPGILGVAGLSLPRLANWPGVDRDPQVFLAKLPILARMGVAAGVQRRQYLRRLPALARGFLVERSPWVVSPVGLDAAVRLLMGEAPLAGKAALDLAQAVASVLATAVQAAARQAHLEVSVDGWPNQKASGAAAEAWGFTTWEASASPRQQIQSGAALVATFGGSVLVRATAFPAEMWQLLQWAWKETRITRLAFELAK